MPSPFARRAVPFAIVAGLVASVTLAFGQVVDHEFLEFDDSVYVTGTPLVVRGLSRDNLIAIGTESQAGNYHPLTTLSYALTFELVGMEARTFHATNVVLHAFNAVLLFLLLRTTTGATWRSAAVAALFAVHPVNVQPVAWTSSRKDVLSFFFAMLALLAWVRHARRPGIGWSVAAVSLFVASLLSKLTFAPLPFALLLLDVWPLRRGRTRFVVGDDAADPPGVVPCPPASGRRLLLEKLPWLVPTLMLLAVNGEAQLRDSAPVAGIDVSVAGRLSRAATNYAAYLGQIAWPANLSASYRPIEEHSRLDVALCVAGLGTISVAALALLRRCPAIPVGWFWYLGMLVPTVGFVPLAETLRADRYLYAPAIGVFLAAVWGIERLSRALRLPPILPTTIVCGAILACATASWFEAAHWRNDLTLFERAVAVDDRSPTAFLNYGTALVRANRPDEAADAYRRSLELSPDSVQARIGLGNVELNRRQFQTALDEFERAVAVAPQDADALLSSSIALRELGRDVEADARLEQALAAAPDSTTVRINAGLVEQHRRGRLDRAVEHFERALRSAPQDERIQRLLAEAQAELERRRIESATPQPNDRP